MDKKTIGIAAAVIGVIVIVGGMVWSAEKDRVREKEERGGEKQVVAMATAAKVTIDQAIKTAVDNFPGKVIEAELGKKDDRTLWEVEILTEEQGIMVVWVDADSGVVVTTEEKGAKQFRDPETKR
jgi:uncharacterized membrane protein YkoI